MARDNGNERHALARLHSANSEARLDATADELELLEFLEADLLPDAAHPAFKRQLREHLLDLLHERELLAAAKLGERGD